jgi:hypothetical protein
MERDMGLLTQDAITRVLCHANSDLRKYDLVR